METAITIFKGIAIVSVICSLLLVAARTYACYIRKPKGCSAGCSCDDDRIVDYDVIVEEKKEEPVQVEEPKPVRKPVKKRVSAIKDGKLVITKVDEPEKKKPGRKKKEL